MNAVYWSEDADAVAQKYQYFPDSTTIEEIRGFAARLRIDSKRGFVRIKHITDGMPEHHPHPELSGE